MPRELTNLAHPPNLDELAATLELAEFFEGATWPNPPVAACAWDADGRWLARHAHRRAGEPHAEVNVFGALPRGKKADTLFVTLEPCNHTGKTPPCTDAIIQAGVRRVIVGAVDPNPRVGGRGIDALRSQGIAVEMLEGELAKRAASLIAPFKQWVSSGRPWITVKTVHAPDGSMIPPHGQKTFSPPSALRFAHHLRRQSGAILTGSGTVLADFPHFTVRNLPDHRSRPERLLGVPDRRGRLQAPEAVSWTEARNQDFVVTIGTEINDIIEKFSQAGVHRILVEAGPTLSGAILSGQIGYWNEHVEIGVGTGGQAVIKTRTCLQAS